MNTMSLTSDCMAHTVSVELHGVKRANIQIFNVSRRTIKENLPCKLWKHKKRKQNSTSVSESLQQGWYTVFCGVMHHQVAGASITFHFKRIHLATSRALWVMSRIMSPYITSGIEPSPGRAYFLWLISLIVLVISPASDIAIHLTLGQWWWCWWRTNHLFVSRSGSVCVTVPVSRIRKPWGSYIQPLPSTSSSPRSNVCSLVHYTLICTHFR